MKEMDKEAQATLERLALKEDTKRKKKKVVLALLQQCKDEGMTVEDVEDICKWATYKARQTTLHGGLTLG